MLALLQNAAAGFRCLMPFSLLFTGALSNYVIALLFILKSMQKFTNLGIC